ncbi:PhoPQ-activated pathogenicity-related family protein [Candidatus Laterigemmans baculatus]|uniref:PhoPQ-activated pathogenicity-related family protein n=1 Tax=Candidatus Laterigemmans baculatus TaxID=2770505 RepID=UPI0013DC05D5|nr:PhoPQ-activated pathogenicity-related family protein [Candidatus Laterigemmans baculatus]
MMHRLFVAAGLLGVLGWSSALAVAEEAAVADPRPVVSTEANTAPTALDRYVAAEDPAYEWKLRSSRKEIGSTVYVLEMVSQKWRASDDVNRTEWRHWLTIAKPNGVTADTAMLFITGGANGGELPESTSREALLLAGATRSVIAELKMVPNQPLVFHGDGTPRKEDDLIGYSWDQFLETGDEQWPAQLPMTKSAVRAMDTIQEFLASDEGGNFEVEKFVVTGASKRGWTTWLTGAVDRRVVAIAPIVIDVLNVNVSMNHHFAAYGFWAPAIGDYVHHQIPHRRFEPRYRELLQIVDPFAYRDRLTMPKCIINASGDQFFLPDSSQFYFKELPGEKHLCYVPNSEHSLRGTNAIDTLAAFHYTVVHGIERPRLKWEFPDANTIRVSASDSPTKVTLWKATNGESRDFRTDTIGRAYESEPLTPDAEGVYTATVPTPEAGWAAFFVQFEFDVDAPTPLRISTPVRVVPEGLPHADTPAPVIEAE